MAAVADSVVKATRAAQAVMREHVPGLIVDGRWGSFTDQTYQALSSQVKRVIDSVLASFNQSPTSVKSAFKSEEVATKTSLGANWISEDKARATLERAASVVGIPYTALRDFLNLEPAKKRMADGVYYNAQSQNGQYKGLFQFNSDAWDSAQKWLSKNRPGVSLGSFSANVFDPYYNSLAAAAYARFNADVVRAQTGTKKEFTGSDYYTMHNQGAGGYMRIAGGGKVEGKQSLAALSQISAVRRA